MLKKEKVSKKAGAQFLTDDVRNNMCWKRKKEKQKRTGVHPPFSSLSEHSTPDNDSFLGGVCSALPSVPWGFHEASTLMHNIIQPRTTWNLRHLTKKREKEGDTTELQIVVSPRETYNRVNTNSKMSLIHVQHLFPFYASVCLVPKLTSVLCNSQAQYVCIIIQYL